jgi:hypothetical protein
MHARRLKINDRDHFTAASAPRGPIVGRRADSVLPAALETLATAARSRSKRAIVPFSGGTGPATFPFVKVNAPGNPPNSAPNEHGSRGMKTFWLILFGVAIPAAGVTPDPLRQGFPWPPSEETACWFDPRIAASRPRQGSKDRRRTAERETAIE